MYVTGLYALFGYLILSIWFVGIMLNLLLAEAAFFPPFLSNTISMIEILMMNGMVGLIASLVLVGQFFLAQHLSSLFKKMSQDNTKN